MSQKLNLYPLLVE